jgi:hypothetical protein
MDMAERYALVLRRSLRWADRFKERAISLGSSSENTPGWRSRALLFSVTRCDHRLALGRVTGDSRLRAVAGERHSAAGRPRGYQG